MMPGSTNSTGRRPLTPVALRAGAIEGASARGW